MPMGRPGILCLLLGALLGIAGTIAYQNVQRKKRRMRIQPSEGELLDSVRHVVYEYANLISSGELLAVQHAYPINTHLQDAFLLSCRKMADFFLWKPTRYPQPQKYDIVASDFTVSPLGYSLPVWKKKWATAMDRQLAHITWKRDLGWDATDNKALMEEQRAAWKKFLANLKPNFQVRFREQINEKKRCLGFENLDLGSV
jgi:hypothetical protein